MPLFLGMITFGVVSFIIMVLITRWLFRIDDIIDRLDRLIMAVEGQPKQTVEQTMTGKAKVAGPTKQTVEQALMDKTKWEGLDL
jgi:hypothetical protein